MKDFACLALAERRHVAHFQTVQTISQDGRYIVKIFCILLVSLVTGACAHQSTVLLSDGHIQAEPSRSLVTQPAIIISEAPPAQESPSILPCPATSNGSAVFPDDTGTANQNVSGTCVAQSGFLPANTLGLQSVDAQGYAVDAWQNRVRYAVTSANDGAFTRDRMNDLGVSALSPDLIVCSSISAAVCTSRINLTNHAVAVIFSLGATANQASVGADESQNLITPTNTTFVSHPITTAASSNGEFDHMVTWLSPYVLYNAMITAGQLH